MQEKIEKKNLLEYEGDYTIIFRSQARPAKHPEITNEMVGKNSYLVRGGKIKEIGSTFLFYNKEGKEGWWGRGFLEAILDNKNKMLWENPAK